MRHLLRLHVQFALVAFGDQFPSSRTPLRSLRLGEHVEPQLRAPDPGAGGSGAGLRLALVGASLDTGNLGVSALMLSIVEGLVRRIPDVSLTIFDNGIGLRSGTVDVDGRSVQVQLCGLRISRRLYLRDSLVNMRLSSWLGGLGNVGVEVIAEADAVLDISGGDSFTDLYGPRRFALVALPKLITLHERTPLLLLPQTYGPFYKARSRRRTATIIQGAYAAWSRDDEGYDVLASFLADSLDPTRHHGGVDVAFLLSTMPAEDRLPSPLKEWVAEDRPWPLIGLNVSGLIYGRSGASNQYGLRVDYDEVVGRLLRRLLAETSARVVLLPHVRGSGAESDDRAAAALRRSLSAEDQGRVTIAPSGLDVRQLKWLISHCDWFCGTRMHSTIAGLSSGVPTTAVAYSIKTEGVFASCGCEDQVVDARQMSTEQAVDQLWHSWLNREAIGRRLRTALPTTTDRAEQVFDELVAHCVDAASSQPRSATTAR